MFSPFETFTIRIEREGTDDYANPNLYTIKRFYGAP